MSALHLGLFAAGQAGLGSVALAASLLLAAWSGRRGW